MLAAEKPTITILRAMNTVSARPGQVVYAMYPTNWDMWT